MLARMPVGEAELELVRKAAAAFNRGDRAAFAACFVSDPEIRPVRAAVDGTVFRGPDSIERFFASAEEIFTDIHVEVEELRPVGEGILLAGPLHARGASSGAETVLPAAWSITFRDGLVATFRTWTDRSDALRDLGVEP
jgi:ketosteroid isomerase-like protein